MAFAVSIVIVIAKQLWPSGEFTVCNSFTGLCETVFLGETCLMSDKSVNICACGCPLLWHGSYLTSHAFPSCMASTSMPWVPCCDVLCINNNKNSYPPCPADGYATAAIGVIACVFTLFAACLPAMVSLLLSLFGSVWWLAYSITATGGSTRLGACFWFKCCSHMMCT